MIDPRVFFKHGRVPCQKCGKVNDLGSSEVLYHADLSTPCVYCGFLIFDHISRQMKKLMEMADKDPEWCDLLRSCRNDEIKRRLNELVPIPKDE